MCHSGAWTFARLGRRAIRRLGPARHRLMDAVGQVVPVLPVSLMATVLLEDLVAPMGELDLKGRVQSLVADLESRGYHVYIPRGDRDTPITVGLTMLTLRNMVRRRPASFGPVPDQVPLLRYYANAIAHLIRRSPGLVVSRDQLDPSS